MPRFALATTALMTTWGTKAKSINPKAVKKTPQPKTDWLGLHRRLLRFRRCVGRRGGRRFFGYLHVVRVAFAEGRESDFQERGVCPQVGEAGRAHIAEAGAEAADQLGDGIGERSFVGDPALHSFGHEGASAFLHLHVSVGGAELHRTDRPHASVHLVGSVAEDLGFTGAFV